MNTYHIFVFIFIHKAQKSKDIMCVNLFMQWKYIKCPYTYSPHSIWEIQHTMMFCSTNNWKLQTCKLQRAPTAPAPSNPSTCSMDLFSSTVLQTITQVLLPVIVSIIYDLINIHNTY